MAADVSCLVRVLNGHKEEGEGKRDLITRDLLGGRGGGGSVLGSAGGVDLESQASSGWDRRLDLLSGRACLQRSGSSPVHRQLQDLNLPPPPPPPPPQPSSAAVPEDSAALDLKLVAPCPSAGNYRSVCTLEKVKQALERAERESRGKHRRPDGSSASPSSSTTSSSFKRRGAVGEEGGEGAESAGSAGGGGMMAAGCPRCLFYVLISKRDPRCPRCDCHVPVPAFKKRPRIDLNSPEN